jgi:hypothetical protein
LIFWPGRALRREFVGRALRRPGPGHELVDAGGGPEIDQLGEHIGEVGLWIDAAQFASFDERSNAGPVLRPLIVASEQCVFSIENNRAHASFDDIGVELDAAVVEETGEPVPVVQGIADVFGDRRLGGDARELPLEPGFERQHQRLALFLPHRPALAGALAADRLLDRIEDGNALKSFAGDRRRAALGDVEESAPQMGPAKGERDCLVARSVCNRLVLISP